MVLVLAFLMMTMQVRPGAAEIKEKREAEAAAKQEATEAAEREAGVAGRGPLELTRIADELTVQPLGLDTWVVVHEQPLAANSLLAKMPDGTLVLCDTPFDNDNTRKLLVWMKKTFGEKSPIVVINSHFHADALGGNGAVRGAGGISYGTRQTAALLGERGERMRQQMLGQLMGSPDMMARFEHVTWLPPQEQFDQGKGLELTFGEEKVVLFYPGPGHSPDNIVTWFPTRRTLFGGCLVRAGKTIPNVADADLEQWPASVERLKSFEPRTVVPGHGRVGGVDLLDHTLDVLAANGKGP